VRVEAVAVVPYTTAVMHNPTDISAIRVKYNGTEPPLGHRRRLQGRSLLHWPKHTADIW
jgi:hypothetical protein